VATFRGGQHFFALQFFAEEIEATFFRTTIFWYYGNSSTVGSSNVDSSTVDLSRFKNGPVHRPSIHQPARFINRWFIDH
jgi:hypothetical protein